MAGLFDLPGMDMNTIVGLLPRLQEAQQRARMTGPQRLNADGSVAVPEAQGFDDSSPAPIVAPPLPMPPPQSLEPGVVPAQGFDASKPAASTGMLPTTPMPPVAALDPENIAKNAAARGIPPPKQDIVPSWANDQALGAALTGASGVPLPMPRPGGGNAVSAIARGGGSPMDIRSAAQQQGEGQSAGAKRDNLLEAFKGVKMPASPELQKLGTPAAPRPHTQLRGGDLLALLQALNASGGQPPALPSLGGSVRK